MSLNGRMHPRNPYRDRPPDFGSLAQKYDEFRSHCYIASNGKLKMNFRDASAVRILARTLLLDDFGLDVELPADCLVPRVPQRLNYVLCVDDLLTANHLSENAIGIDIGTGASCIYALLGAKQCGWKFLATDADALAVEVASENVRRNGLSERIQVVRVAADCMIKDVVRSHPETNFTFCMCNPPFYEFDEFEEKYRCLKDDVMRNVVDESVRLDRPAPHSATVARSNELAVMGGEVAFISRLIEDSFVLQNAVKLYTSMVGKKSSLVELRKKLGRCLSVRSTVTTLCQGKTQRWVLLWTFEPRVKLINPTKFTPPLVLFLPSVLEGKESSFAWIKKVLAMLEVSCEKQDDDSYLCEAVKNTWSQQRQKRRANQIANVCPPLSKRYCLGRTNIGCMANLGSGDGKDSYSEAGNFNECIAFYRSLNGADIRDMSIQTYLPMNGDLQTLIRFRLVLDSAEHCLRLYWMDGSRHSLHQIWQFCKNQLIKLGKSLHFSSS